MKGEISHIGLVAGDKNLPFLICDFARQNNVEISVMGIRGCVSASLKKKVKKDSYREFYLSELSKTISFANTSALISSKLSVTTLIIESFLETLTPKSYILLPRIISKKV